MVCPHLHQIRRWQRGQQKQKHRFVQQLTISPSSLLQSTLLTYLPVARASVLFFGAIFSYFPPATARPLCLCLSLLCTKSHSYFVSSAQSCAIHRYMPCAREQEGCKGFDNGKEVYTLCLRYDMARCALPSNLGTIKL